MRTGARQSAAVPVLSYGFRPFFLLAALFAAVTVPVWLAVLLLGAELSSPFAPRDWHVHEMVFGYLAAVVAGFILTAVPNWTGRLPVQGWPLAALAGLWIAGRIACSGLSSPAAAVLFDVPFLVVLAGLIWREIVAGRHWRGLPVAALVSVLGAGNVLFHLQQLWPAIEGYGERLGLAAAALLLGLIGGRITPSFTRNWMARIGIEPLPIPFGSFDRLVLAMAALAMAFWVVAPAYPGSGIALVMAGLLHGVRLVRWRGLPAIREPIVFVLHVGYFWLALAFVLLGAAILAPTWVPASAAVHALTVGAVGTMTLAVMTRASLGHTGRSVTSGATVNAIYCAVTMAALLRMAAPFLPFDYAVLLVLAGGAWTIAFGLFAVAFAPLLLTATRQGPMAQGG